MRGWDRSCQKRLQLLVSPAGFTEPKETPHNGTRLSNRGDSAHYLLKNHSFYRPIVSGPVFSPTDHSLPPSPPGWKTLQRGKRLVTTSLQGERTLHEGTSVYRAYRGGKRRCGKVPEKSCSLAMVISRRCARGLRDTIRSLWPRPVNYQAVCQYSVTTPTRRCFRSTDAIIIERAGAEHG